MLWVVVASFLIGKANLAILKSHKVKNEGQDADMISMFKSLVETRIVVLYLFYQQMEIQVVGKWGVREWIGTINDLKKLVFLTGAID